MKALQPIFDAFDAGRAALFVAGRSLHDVDLDGDGHLRPLYAGLRRSCRERYGQHLIIYGLARGVDWDEGRLRGGNDEQRIRRLLEAHGVIAPQREADEVPRVMRGVSTLLRAPTSEAWSDGRPLRFAFLFEFAEHLLPGSLVNGTQSDVQVVAAELAFHMSTSHALRDSGNVALFSGRDGLVDELVMGALHRVRLRQPQRDDKRVLYDALTKIYPGARLDTDLAPDEVAHLTANTPNHGLEQLMRMSDRTGAPVTAAALAAARNVAVEQMSEHTLSVLDTAAADDLKLYGRNIRVPWDILARHAAGLAMGNPLISSAFMLTGPHGVGKSTLAKWAARAAKAPGYVMRSPKDGLVGGSERKAVIQQDVLIEAAPSIAYADEMPEAFPMQRSDFDGDSGASAAVQAALLSALADESRRGRTILIATTNRPGMMGAAMRSRFRVVPVLSPLRDDMPEIVAGVAGHVLPECSLAADDALVQEAASMFSDKGATPRDIRAALSEAVLANPTGAPADLVLEAALDLCESADGDAIAYADLVAIELTSLSRYYPWSGASETYPYPPHLQGVIDPATGRVDRGELHRRIKELKPNVNI